MTTCPVCGAVNPQGATYCENCGVELSAAAHNAAPGDWTTVTVVPNAEGQIVPPSSPAQSSTVVEPTVVGSSVLEAPAQTVSPAEPVTAPDTRAARLGLKRFGAATGDLIPLGGQRLVVGRFDASSGPVDVDLTGLQGAEHISRRHAELYSEGGGWYVRDLGSTNGVYLRPAGEDSFSPRLQAPARLQNGDEIAFGNLTVIFHED